MTVGRSRFLHALPKRWRQRLGVFDANAAAAHRPGDRGVIHLDEVGRLVAAAHHRVLQRLDVARGGVVDDNHREAAAGTPRRFEFAKHHVEAAVAADRDDRAVRRGERGAHPARQPIADRREAAIGDEVPPRRLGVVEQSSPVPGEPAIGDEDRVLRQGAVQLAAQPRHVHRPVARVEPRRRVVLPGLHARGDLGDVIGAGGTSRLAAIG